VLRCVCVRTSCEARGPEPLMSPRNKPNPPPRVAEPGDKQPPACKPAPRSCKHKIGLDDVTWAMMLMAIREPAREEKKRDSA
jgi:hypothetical protein